MCRLLLGLLFCFQQLKKVGFKHIEIWTGPMHFFVDNNENENIDKLKNLSEKYGIKIIAICPEQTNPKPNNIASAKRKKEIFNYYKRIIDISEKLGANRVVITSGWAYLNEDKTEAYKRSIIMMKKIAKYAQKKKVILFMEALQPEESVLVNTSLDLARYINEVNESNLKVCIDFGAMAKAKESIEDYFVNCNGLIEHVHFVDGDPTGHLAYPDGSRDIIEDLSKLKKYGYNGYLSCESVASRYYKQPWIADEKNYKSFVDGKEGLK